MNTQKKEGAAGQHLIKAQGMQQTKSKLNDLSSVYVKVASLNENVVKGERKDIKEHGIKKPSVGKSYKYLTCLLY